MSVVNDWRSQWQIDMRYSDASVDDLIADMADLHTEVKLQAIVSCARAVEFAAGQSPGEIYQLDGLTYLVA